MITCEKQGIQGSAIHPKLPQCIPMNVNQFALVSSIFTLGGLVGALLSGPFCNNKGRLPAMRLVTASFVVGPVCQSLAPNFPVMALGRFISGLGAGAGVVVVPIYISEIAPPKEKGLFGAFTQIMVNVGILVAQVLGYFLSRDSLWRIILATAGVVGVIQFIALSIVPESPKWLAENGQPPRAREILRKLRGRRMDIDEEVKAWKIDSSEQDIGTRLKLLSHFSLTSFSRRRVPSQIPFQLKRFLKIQVSRQLRQHLRSNTTSHLPSRHHRCDRSDARSAAYRDKQHYHVFRQSPLVSPPNFRCPPHRRSLRT